VGVGKHGAVRFVLLVIAAGALVWALEPVRRVQQRDAVVICDYLAYDAPQAEGRRPYGNLDGTSKESGYCDFFWIEERQRLAGRVWLRGIVYPVWRTVTWVSESAIAPRAEIPTTFDCVDGSERSGRPPPPCPEDVLYARAQAKVISWAEAQAIANRLPLLPLRTSTR
jgi:hypothetical protein